MFSQLEPRKGKQKSQKERKRKTVFCQPTSLGLSKYLEGLPKQIDFIKIFLIYFNIIRVDIDKTAISTHNEDVYVPKLLLTSMMRQIRVPNDEEQVTSQCHSSFVRVFSLNQELNKYPIPSIMKPRKSKRPECIRVPNYN